MDHQREPQPEPQQQQQRPQHQQQQDEQKPQLQQSPQQPQSQQNQPQHFRQNDAGVQQPSYDVKNGGHYGASALLAAKGYAPQSELYGGTFANVIRGLQGPSRDILTTYWQHAVHHLETDEHDFKVHQLPLARIKKVMKSDPEVRMISAEAPVLFAKACDIFITELTMRAWIHAEDNKRRTLQRSDIAAALSKSDMFDFLIDIVPREEAVTHSKRAAVAQPPPGSAAAAAAAAAAASAAAEATAQRSIPPGIPAPHPHQMPPTNYGQLPHHPMTEQEYRSQIYGNPVPPSPETGYAQPQPQMVGGMYPAYGQLPPQH